MREGEAQRHVTESSRAGMSFCRLPPLLLTHDRVHTALPRHASDIADVQQQQRRQQRRRTGDDLDDARLAVHLQLQPHALARVCITHPVRRSADSAPRVLHAKKNFDPEHPLARDSKGRSLALVLYSIQFVSCPSPLALCISHPLPIPRGPQCQRARVNVFECRGGKRSKVSPRGALNLPAARFLQTI